MLNVFTRRPMADVLARTATALLLTGSLLAAGCAAENVGYTPLNPPPRRMSARPAAAVEVFTITPPRRAHTDIGLLRVVGVKPPPSTHTDIGFDVPEPVSPRDEGQEMIAALRERAARIGCDAILVTHIDRPLVWEPWVEYAGARLPSAQASCVVYNDNDADL
jgi:hypothetical protein